MYLGLEVGTIWSGVCGLFLAVGVMGGFTTYSSFNHETLALAQRGQWALASAYVGATLLGAWVAGLAGLLRGGLVAPGGCRSLPGPDPAFGAPTLDAPPFGDIPRRAIARPAGGPGIPGPFGASGL